MERLTLWIDDGEHKFAISDMTSHKIGHRDCLNKLAEYEDLEEQGLLIRLDDASYSAKLAIIDEVSEWLQMSGYTDASKAVDCHWNL